MSNTNKPGHDDVNGSRRGFLRKIATLGAGIGAVGILGVGVGELVKRSSLATDSIIDSTPISMEVSNLDTFITLVQNLNYPNELDFTLIKSQAMKKGEKIQKADVINSAGGGAIVGAIVGAATSGNDVIGEGKSFAKSVVIGASGGALLGATMPVFEKTDQQVASSVYDMGMKTQYISSRFQAGQENFTINELKKESHRLKALMV